MSEEIHSTRKTAVILISKIIFWVVVFNLSFITLTFLGDIMGEGTGESFASVLKYDTFIAVGLTILQILIILFIAVKWAKQYYEVKSEFVTAFSGIIFKRQDKVNIVNIDTISYTQSFFGKIFKYGTVIIEYGRNEKMNVFDIPFPDEFINFIEKNRNARKNN